MFQNLHQAIRKNEIVIKCQIGYLKSTSNTSNEKIHFEEGSVAINGFFMKIVLLKNLKGTIFLPSYTIVKKFLYLEFLFKFREAGGYDFMIKLNDKSMTQFNEIFTYLNDANMKLINPIPSFDNKLCLFYLYDSQYHLDIKKIYKLGIEKDVLNIIPQYQNNKSDNFTMDQLSFKNDHFMFDMFPTIEVNSNTIPEPIVYIYNKNKLLYILEIDNMDYIMVKSMIYHLYNKQEKILAKKEAERKSTLLINEIAHLKGKKSETIKRQNEKINDTLRKNDNTFIEVIKEPDGIEYDFPLTQISPLNKNLFQLSEKTKNEQPLKNHSRYQKDIYSSVIKNRSNLETMSEHKDLMLADPKVENQKSYYGESKVHLNQKKRNHEKYIPDIKIQEIREFINKSNNLEVQSLNLTNTDISELIIISKNTIHRQLKADLINEYEHNDKSNIPLIIRKTTMIHQFNNYIVQYFENKTKKEGVKEEKSHRNFRRLSKVDNNPGKNVNENEHIIEIEKNHIEWISSIKDKIQDINFKSYHDDSDLIITINSLIISKINEKSSNDETLISWLEFNLDEKDITQLLFLEILKSIKERNLFCLFSEAMKDHYISFLFKYMLHIKLNTEDQSFIIGPDSIIDNQVVLLKLYRIYSKLHF